MPHPGQHNLTDPERRAEAFAAYQAGESLSSVATRFNVAPITLKRLLTEAGVPIRSRSEQFRIETLRRYGSEFREISRDRLWELYWGPERPSLSTLAKQLGLSGGHLSRILAEHGIATRTGAEQVRIDGKMGRRPWGNPRFFDQPPERQAEIKAKQSAAKTGKKQSKAHVRNNVRARQKSETRPCAWCAAPVTRIPCRFTLSPRVYCGHSCANYGSNWRRRFPDTPRPLILLRLKALLQSRPPTLALLERLAPECGAGDPEIQELILGQL